MLGLRSPRRESVMYVILCAVPAVYPTVVGALPRDPNNSALLYYQACFLCPPELPGTFNTVVRGGDPNDQVRQYLTHSPWPETLELIQAGTRLPQCDWGPLYSQGRPLPLPLIRSLSRLSYLLGVQAQTLAVDGQFREALEHGIAMRRFAAHIGDETFGMWVVSEKMDAAAVSALRYVLAVMPPDEALLAWLRDRLQSQPGAPWHPENALSRFRDLDVQLWRAHPGQQKHDRENFVSAIEDEAVREKMRNLNEVQFFDLAFQSLDTSLRRALEVLRSDVPYDQKCTELAGIVARARRNAENGDPVAFLVDSIEHMDSYYRLHMNALAPRNALMNAMEVYLVRARTGRLPQELPAHLPEDPYSGKPFEYEITKEGFVLRCQAKSVDFRDIRQFTFTIHAQ